MRWTVNPLSGRWRIRAMTPGVGRRAPAPDLLSDPVGVAAFVGEHDAVDREEL